MKSKQKRIRYREGSIIAVPLPGYGYAIARAYRNSAFGILSTLAERIPESPSSLDLEVAFFCVGTDDAIKSGEWPVVGDLPFSDPESAWPPPMATCYLRETNEWTMGGQPRVQHRGEMKLATQAEVRGLDIFSVGHNPEHMVRVIIDRLIHGNHAKYRVREE